MKGRVSSIALREQGDATYRRIRLCGNVAHVADANGRLWRIDITEPHAPYYRNNRTFNISPGSLVHYHGVLYSGGNQETLTAVDPLGEE